jgi:transcriptional regulator with XRE-family HTH domain
MDSQELGRLIKAWREFKGQTQEQASKALGMSRSRWAKLETGEAELSASEFLNAAEHLAGGLKDFEAGPPGYRPEPRSEAPAPGACPRQDSASPPSAAPPAAPAFPSSPWRDVLRLIAVLASALYLAQEAREFLGLAAATFKEFPPKAYLGILGAAFGGREWLAWQGGADALASLEAGAIVVLWWLWFFAAVILARLHPAGLRVPGELLTLASGASAVLAGAGLSRGVRRARAAKRSKSAALPPPEPRPATVPELAIAAFTALAGAGLFGWYLLAAFPIHPPAPPSPPARRRASPVSRPQAPARPAPPEGAGLEIPRPRPPGSLLAAPAEFSLRLIGNFPAVRAFFAGSEAALPLVELVFAAPDGPVAGYEFLQEDGLRWLFPERYGPLAAELGGHELFITQLVPEPQDSRLRLEGENPGLHLGQLLVYPEASPGLDVFFILGRQVYQGLLLHDRPRRLSVPGRRFGERPAVLVFFLEGSARALPGKPDLVGKPVVRELSGPSDQAVEILSRETGTAVLIRPPCKACGTNRRCVPVFNKIAARGDGWTWHQWFFDGDLDYPVALLPEAPGAPSLGAAR